VLLADGIDPLDQKHAQRAERAVKVRTFRQVAEEYEQLHRAKWKGDRPQFLKSLERHAYGRIGDVDVKNIETDAVLDVIRPIWTTTPETASRVRGRIETVLDYAIASKYRTGVNPAKWTGHLESILPAPTDIRPVKHRAALPFREVAAFVAELRQREGVAARALEFTILCAVRTGEELGARWEEIDLTDAVWVVPGSRTKTGKALRVPLSPPVLSLLQALPREGDMVFIGRFAGRGLGEAAMYDVATALRKGITTHGFRSCFRDWASELTTHDPHVCEQALGHAIASSVERAYRRGDLFQKRIALMRDWALYCGGELAGSNVIPLRAAGG